MSESQNSLVSERRLRPVYEALNSGNSRVAQHEAEKALRKQPDLLCARAFLGLALFRSGKEREAQVQVQRVVDAKPVEENTLQALTIYFKDTLQYDQISLVYTNALTKDPNNEELLSHLFMALVRQGEVYQEQQKIAMQLAKLRPNKTPYFLWAIISIVLQSMHSKQNAQVMLQLASRMMEKKRLDNSMSNNIDESEDNNNAVNSEHFTMLLLLILERQTKYEEALKILNGPLGRLLKQRSSRWCLTSLKKLDYLRRLKMWTQLNSVAKSVIQIKTMLLPSSYYRHSIKCMYFFIYLTTDSPDQWNAWEAYVDSVLFNDSKDDGAHNDVDKDAEENNFTVDKSVDSAVTYINEKMEESSSCRGPFLAKLLLVKAQLPSESSSSELVSLIFEFIEAFGSKPSCFADLKQFIREADKNELSTICDQKLADENLTKPVDIPSVHRHLCYLQLQRFIGSQTLSSLIHPEKLIGQLTEYFNNTRSLVKDVAETDVRANDRYVLIASFIKWDLWITSGDDQHCISAIAMLREALQESPANHVLSFALLKFFNRAGAVYSSLGVYSRLQLKHIQLDTLGHWVTRWLHSCGHFNAYGSLARESLMFFSSADREISEHLIGAYRWGSFEKIIEMVELKERLRHSFNFISLRIELKLNNLLCEVSDHKNASEVLLEDFGDNAKMCNIDFELLHDNRDFDVVTHCEPASTREKAQELQRATFEREKIFLRLRRNTFKALMASFDFTSPTQNRTNRDNVTCIQDVIEEFKAQMSSHDDTIRTFSSFQDPDESRVEVLLGYGQTLILIFESFLHFYRRLNNEEQPEKNGPNEIFAELTQNLKSHLQDCSKSNVVMKCVEPIGGTNAGLRDRAKAMESWVNFLEICSMTVMLLGVCAQLVSQWAQTSSQSSKKKKKQQQEPAHIADLRSELGGASRSLESLLKDSTATINIIKTESSLSLLSISEKIEEKGTREVRNELKDSFENSWSEFANVVNMKLKYLQGLKL